MAQNSLKNSRTSSYYTYIYPASDLVVERLYNGKPLNDSDFKSPVDSFLTDSKTVSTLSPGNYLKVVAQNNNLSYSLIQNRTAHFHLLDNRKELQFVLTDPVGREITEAKVFVGNKPILYNANYKRWLAPYPKKEDNLVKVIYNGVTNYSEMSFDGDYKPNKQSKLQRFWLRYPARYVYFPIVRLSYRARGKKVPYKYRFHKPNKNRTKEAPTAGYMVFNKPMYKPLDTVKFKAFILTGKRFKPLNTPLIASLYNDGVRKDLGEIKPLHEGSYDFSFYLHDSLKLRLDRNYSIQLADKKNKVYRRGGFRYEDYELKSVSFSFRGDKEKHDEKHLQSLYFKATDENGLNVLDGKVELTIENKAVRGFYKERIFIPDTLWQHSFKLDAIGETKVVIPDSVFLKTDLNYEVKAVFLSSSNESRKTSRSFSYTVSSNHDLEFKADDDSLSINYKYTPVKSSPVKIQAINSQGDTLETLQTLLPAKIKLNYFAAEYEVEGDSLLDYFEIEDLSADLKLNTYKTSDSLFLKSSNPHKIPFWYTILNGNKVVDRGSAVDLIYKKRNGFKGVVTILYNYVWGDEPFREQAQVRYSDKALILDVKQPLAVSPGENVAIDVSVTDPDGKSVKDVDLTAYSFTSKFSYSRPPIPYLGKQKGATVKFRPELEWDEGIGQRSIPLKWSRWGKEIGLDSIEYFRFTHPAPIYKHQEDAPGGVTQIAPFVMDKGEILPIEILYIDNKAVYFSQAQHLNRYSFEVAPGKVHLKFRLKDKLVIAGSHYVPEGKKLVLSFNIDTVGNKSVSVLPQPSTLSAAEASALNNYMLTITDTYSPRFATIDQPDRLYLLWPSGTKKLVGPLASNYARYQVRGDKPVRFQVEPNYEYSINPGLIKQKSLPGTYAFNPNLESKNPPSYKEVVLLEEEVNSFWNHYLDSRSHNASLFNNPYVSPSGNGHLAIKIKSAEQGERLPFIKSILIYKYDNPDFLQIYSGNQTSMGYFAPGRYRLLFLLKGDSYVLINDVDVKANGKNLLQIDLAKPLPKDETSTKIAAEILAVLLSNGQRPVDGIEKIKQAFNDHYTDYGSYSQSMSGYVVDEEREPLAGVTITVKGTTSRTVSNAQGYFTIKVPQQGSLLFQFLGFSTHELKVNRSVVNHIVMKANRAQLDEVVVIGYGTQSKRDVVGSVSYFSGVAAGVQIRGNSTLNNNAGPLYIIDGIPVTGGVENLKPDEIGEMSILKDAAATAIYGARGANGVVIITTKKAKAEAQQAMAEGAANNGLSIRKNFSDYAFWQPRLRTNAEGKATFNVTFPDNITNWRTFFIAMNGNRQSGYTESNIKSFKPLSAAFASPAFAIAGDVFHPIGKISNYTTESASVNREFKFNDKTVSSTKLSVKNAHIDTFKVVAEGLDSLKFSYSLQKEGGYSDGEERRIPVFSAGTIETKGIFAALEQDTSMSLSLDPKLGKITFRAEASVLPALLDETEHLRNYQYLCNEQAASKLKALLVQKRIKNYLKQPFENEKAIKDLIKRLDTERRADGTWGWWKNSNGELWISRHVIEAYLEAEKAGYKVPFKKQGLIDQLVYQVSRYNGMDKVEALTLLNKMNAQVDYKTPLAMHEKDLRNAKTAMPLYEKLRLMELKQNVGLPVGIDSLLRYQHFTMFGNMYFGENNYRFFDNSIQNSLLAYKIIKVEGKRPEWLSKIRNFLLEQRRDGYWRNTYESALILETILPDLLNEDKKFKPTSLSLTADKTEVIDKFPYSTTLDADAKINIQKQGDLPVYITAYQQFLNQKPEKVSKDFRVDTWFSNANGSRKEVLKGGQAIILKAKIFAKADADFVMIEIPIPAGCSYEEKEQSWWGQEVHREYFKNKVSIFCRKLKEGEHTFNVKLMPRYDGTYNLNPAKAELMYFPVFYGREEMKKVRIGE